MATDAWGKGRQSKHGGDCMDGAVAFFESRNGRNKKQSYNVLFILGVAILVINIKTKRCVELSNIGAIQSVDHILKG